MLDPALMQALLSGLPAIVSPSALIATSSLVRGEIAEVERELIIDAENRRGSIEQWLRQMKDAIAHAQQSGEKITIAQVSQLTEAVERMEYHAEDFAERARRAHKVIDKAVRRSEAFSPDRKAMLKRMDKRSREIDDFTLRGILDLTDCIRAMRAAYSPDAGTGPVFSDPDTLERYLNALGT